MSVNSIPRKIRYRYLVWIAITIPIAIFFLYVVTLIGQANLDRIRLSESTRPTKLTDVPQFTPLTSAEVYHGMLFASKIRTFNSNNNSASDKLSPSGATEFYEDESRRQASFVQTEAEEKTKEAETILIDISIRKKNNLALIKKRQTEIDFVSDEADVMHYLAAYFAHGYTQPDKESREWRTSTFGPVSLSSLISFGAMERSDSGIGKFREAITSPRSDRVGFAIPRAIPDHGFDVFSLLRHAQGLLIKYQEILVEKGLLAP